MLVSTKYGSPTTFVTLYRVILPVHLLFSFRPGVDDVRACAGVQEARGDRAAVPAVRRLRGLAGEQARPKWSIRQARQQDHAVS